MIGTMKRTKDQKTAPPLVPISNQKGMLLEGEPSLLFSDAIPKEVFSKALMLHLVLQEATGIEFPPDFWEGARPLAFDRGVAEKASVPVMIWLPTANKVSSLITNSIFEKKLLFSKTQGLLLVESIVISKSELKAFLFETTHKQYHNRADNASGEVTPPDHLRNDTLPVVWFLLRREKIVM